MKKALIILALIAICFLALYYRVILPDPWLHGETLRLPTVDAYYQARFIELINSHGVNLPDKDPYFMSTGNPPLSDITLWPTIISGVAQLIPQNGTELACYYIPPLLAVLCVIGVFIIGTLLFNAWAGLFGALLIATMGGELMARTIAGNIDYHCFEAFLCVFVVMCVIMAVRYHNKGWVNYIFSILAGVLMAVYLRSWSGAIYLYLIFIVSYVLYLIILSLKREAPSGAILQIPLVMIASTILFYIIIAQLLNGAVDNNVLLVSGLFLAVALITTLIQIFFLHRNRWALLIISIVVAAVTLIILYMFAKNYFRYVNGIVMSIVEWNAISHTSEERPILIFGNEFSLQALWGNFTASIFMCLIGIGVVIKKIVNADRHTLFNYVFIILGTLTMVISTLAMIRFAYYLAIYVAILSGMVIVMILEIATNYLKKNFKKMKWFDKAGDILLVLIILTFILMPNFMISNQFSHPLEGSITTGWEQAMLWMRSNTPEPFDDANYYYANYKDNLQEPNYSVMSWWDYGYWITYVAHRVPTCNPGSTNRDVPAVFLTTTDNEKAVTVLKQAKSRYIVIDYQTATGKFTAMPTYAERASKDLRDLWSWESPGFISVFYYGNKDKIERMTIFHPDYYRSMVVRLFNFDGQAVKSPGCPILIYKDIDGQKWIQKIIDTPSFDEAQKYMKEHPLTDDTQYSFGGVDPFLPCVDLEEVKEIKPIKGFGGVDLSMMSQTVKQTYEVKLFEYTGGF